MVTTYDFMLADRADIEQLEGFQIQADKVAQRKIDGGRLYMKKDIDGTVHLFARKRASGTQSDYAAMGNLPEIKATVDKFRNDTWLDGEICALDERGKINRSLVARRCKTTTKGKIQQLMRDIPVFVYCFDILKLEGKDLRQLPYLKRAEMLEKFLMELNEPLLKNLPIVTNHGNNFKELFASESEGVIIKTSWSPYLHKRCNYWVKIKHVQSEIVSIVGYNEGEGKASGMFGSLVTVDDEGKYAGNVGGGFTDTERETLTRILRALPERVMNPSLRKEVGENFIQVEDCPFKLEVSMDCKGNLGRSYCPRMKNIIYDKPHSVPLSDKQLLYSRLF